MPKSNPNLKVTKPKNVFDKPMTADFKELFKAISKVIGHTATGKWDEVGSDAMEALCAIGLSTEPSELAFLLIRRSITRAFFDLIGESASQYLTDAKTKIDEITDHLELSIRIEEAHINKKFLDRPSDLPVVNALKDLMRKWLEAVGLPNSVAVAISGRFPSYFVYALNQEWRKNSKSYRPLIEALDTPFSKAGDREWAWTAYSALLRRRIEESIFDEPFSLLQIYVPLNAYYLEEQQKKDFAEEMPQFGQGRRRVVVKLEEELELWLEELESQDTMRVISGGPGCGKSSFAKVFAACLSSKEKLKVLFVPLHLIDPTKDLVDEIGRFVRDEGILIQNPLNPESPEPNLLIIFDGLDELANQGKASAETARAFIREVDRIVEKRNASSVHLRVLISGREVAIQENESEFRRPRQILNLLPYYLGDRDEEMIHRIVRTEECHDPKELLKEDLHQIWWKNYGKLTGKDFTGLPKELARADLEEITAQPLLNYLIALSFTREKIDFQKNVNLNEVYADLVSAVHERAYEKKRPYVPIRHMTLPNFMRVLEEIGLAAWHGDGRTTTVREIEEHCRTSGVGSLLEAFEEGARAGVTRLLAAFFFRQYGRRPSGDPTFVFTHKSFGEYLASRRVVRAIEKVTREIQSRRDNPDEGWDEREALKHWAQICGPSAISQYLHSFLLDELRLREPEKVSKMQECFTKLFSYILQHGMPMELVQLPSFRIVSFQSRNAEEALLVALNCCARLSKQISMINHPDPTVFGAWFRRIQGQRTGPEPCLAATCLSGLNLSNTSLHISDFFGADFEGSDLSGIGSYYSCLSMTNLRKANLKGAGLRSSNLEWANLQGANLEGAELERAYLERANLKGANLKGAKLEGADLQNANLQGAKLQKANLRRAKLQKANLRGANLKGAKLLETILSKKTRIASKDAISQPIVSRPVSKQE